MTIRCAVVGATGIAGQQFLSALQGHPFFEVVRLAASARSAGKSYRQALTQPSGQVAWWDTPDALDRFGDMEVVEATQMSLEGVDLVFSAVESEPAWELESRFAERVPVISTASAERVQRSTVHHQRPSTEVSARVKLRATSRVIARLPRRSAPSPDRGRRRRDARSS